MLPRMISVEKPVMLLVWKKRVKDKRIRLFGISECASGSTALKDGDLFTCKMILR